MKARLRNFEGNYTRFELRDYEVFPKILKCGEKSRICIRPLGRHAAFDENAEYWIAFMPMEASIEPIGYNEYPHTVKKQENGRLIFEHVFEGEQEHIIKVFKLPDTPENGKPIGIFHVYSLMEDLYSRRPYRGDFHAHTCESDGSEEPAIVAAKYREYGFDFLSITDHRKWYPSEEAINAYKGVSIDLKLFHGEEVHAFDNHIHIVNFGSNASVNEFFQNNKECYYREVEEIASNSSFPEGVNAFEYASSVWVFNKIREFGGMGIFAHPHWIPNVYHVPQKMVNYLFQTKPFDAFELLGGHEVACNNIQTAYYNEMRAEGLKIPIVGSSDSHGDHEYFNWFSTIVFAKEMKTDSIIESVKNLYSVAIEQYPGEDYRVYGPFRMVKYAMFLLEEYFPFHAKLCFEEGRQMKNYISGDAQAADILECLKGRTSKFMEKCFKTI